MNRPNINEFQKNKSRKKTLELYHEITAYSQEQDKYIDYLESVVNKNNDIHDVSNRRELLIAFQQDLESKGLLKFGFDLNSVDGFLSNQ